MSDPNPSPRSLDARGPIRGELRPPASKSMAQRALVMAALSPGASRLVGAGDRPGQDVARALELVRGLGRPVTPMGDGTLVVDGEGCGHAGGLHPAGPLEVGESGTLARFATALAGLCCRAPVEVRGTGTLARRHSPALMAALTRAGASIEPVHGAAPGGWPVLVRGTGPPSDLELAHPGSSQELSALLLAAAAYPDPIHVHLTGDLPSRPYVELTVDVLRAFAVAVERLEPCRGHSLCLSVAGAPQAAELELEPDASAAAVGLAAAAITGGDLTVPGPWHASRQGDADMPDFLAAFGLTAERRPFALATAGAVRRGADLDLGGHPDLAPPLAVVAAAAALATGEVSHLAGLGTLRGKESDRLAGLARALTAAGVAAEVQGDVLRVAPGTDATTGPQVLDPEGDHRMAFAGALLGLLRPGLTVSDPGVVAKSWPTFWDDLAACGDPAAGATPS